MNQEVGEELKQNKEVLEVRRTFLLDEDAEGGNPDDLSGSDEHLVLHSQAQFLAEVLQRMREVFELVQQNVGEGQMIVGVFYPFDINGSFSLSHRQSVLVGVADHDELELVVGVLLDELDEHPLEGVVAVENNHVLHHQTNKHQV